MVCVKFFGLVLLAFGGLAFGADKKTLPETPKVKPVDLIPWSKVQSYPHDPEAFTQGLVFLDSHTLVETTGLYGKSEIRKVETKTGKVLSSTPLAKEFFGEGLTVIGKRWIQLTWQEGTAIEWSLNKSSKWVESKKHSYTGQGWGLATDGKILYMSDGTSNIQVKDPDSFKTIKTLSITAEGKPFDQLNELEFIDGFLFANRWMSSMIVKIDVKTGNVVGIIDLASLVPDNLTRSPAEAVLNGIAWDPQKKQMYVTGKYWPVMYGIQLNGPKKPKP